MELRPLHDRVVIKRLEEGETKRGGIIIPDTAKEKPQQGEVKAVGSGKLLETGERMPPEVKAGDRILFGRQTAGDRRAHAARSQSRRPHPVRQVLRRRSKARWRRVPDPQRGRDTGRAGIERWEAASVTDAQTWRSAPRVEYARGDRWRATRKC